MELYVKQKQKCIDTQMLSKFLIAKSYFMYPKAKTGLLEHSQFGSYIKNILHAKLAKHDIKVV